MVSGLKAETTRKAHPGSWFQNSSSGRGAFVQGGLPPRHTSKTAIRYIQAIINSFEITLETHKTS